MFTISISRDKPLFDIRNQWHVYVKSPPEKSHAKTSNIRRLFGDLLTYWQRINQHKLGLNSRRPLWWPTGNPCEPAYLFYCFDLSPMAWLSNSLCPNNAGTGRLLHDSFHQNTKLLLYNWNIHEQRVKKTNKKRINKRKSDSPSTTQTSVLLMYYYFPDSAP